MPDALSHTGTTNDAAALVDAGSTTERRMRIGGSLQHQAFALAKALGCTGEALAGYVGSTRAAVCRWAAGDRDMPSEQLARIVALLPWLVVHRGFQMAVARDRAGARTLAKLERAVDALVRVALNDARLAVAVERAWSSIFTGLDSEAARAALSRITMTHLLRRPAGSA